MGIPNLRNLRRTHAKDGSEMFVLANDDGTEQALSSRYSPLREAERMLAPHKSKADSVRVVFCFGAGHLPLNHLIAETFKKSVCVFVEAHQPLLEAAKKNLKDSDSDRLHFCGPDDYKNAAKALFKEQPSSHVLFLHNRSQANLHGNFYPEAKRFIQEEHEKRSINIATLSRFESLWLRNITQNTNEILGAGPCSSLKNLCQGLPILVLAPGPSLAGKLELVRRSQHNVFTIALDTTYKTLLKNGIFPDMVVVVDPQKVNSRYIENVPEERLGEPLVVAEPAVCPKGIRGKKNLFMFDTIFPYYNLLCNFFGKKGNLDMGGSVATTAYELVQLLSCNAACFVGLDLCTTNQTYHIPGTMYEEEWFSEVDRKEPYETKLFGLLNPSSLRALKAPSGRVVYVDAKFVLFRNWFERRLASNSLALFNSAPDIPPLKGMPTMPLSEFLQTYAPKPIDKATLKKRFASRKESASPNQPSKERMNNFLAELQTIVDSILGTAKDARKSLDLCQTILDHLRSGRGYEEELHRLERLDAKLQKPSVGKVFVNITMQQAIHKVGSENASSNASEVFLNSKAFYKSLLESSELNISCFRKILNCPDDPLTG